MNPMIFLLRLCCTLYSTERLPLLAWMNSITQQLGEDHAQIVFHCMYLLLEHFGCIKAWIPNWEFPPKGSLLSHNGSEIIDVAARCSNCQAQRRSRIRSSYNPQNNELSNRHSISHKFKLIRYFLGPTRPQNKDKFDNWSDAIICFLFRNQEINRKGSCLLILLLPRHIMSQQITIRLKC